MKAVGDRSESELTTRNRATLSDVARHASVSLVTVSRAIRHPEMVYEELRKRIAGAVRKLNYIPSHLASARAPPAHRSSASPFSDILHRLNLISAKAG